jgi:GNAT superfamily N-acetyltransferase
MGKTKLRSAVPGDSRRIAYLSYLAGRGHARMSAYDLIFPGHPVGPTPKRLDEMASVLTTDTRSWFHFSRHAVVDVEGRAVATLCAFPRKEGNAGPLFMAFREVGWTKERIDLMRKEMRSFTSTEIDIPLDSWVIEDVGCYEEYRRRGFVKALLESSVEAGRESGLRNARLSVFIGNEPAIKAYENFGFVITGEKRHPDFEAVFGCPGTYQMTLKM